MSLATDLEIPSAVAAVAASVAAWRAANGSREAARHMRLGHLIEVHQRRLSTLRDLHSRISWITEGGKQYGQRPKYERFAVKLGVAPGTTIVEGVELLGVVLSIGVDLPQCLKVAEHLKSMDIGGAPISAAEQELRRAMEIENRTLDSLEGQLRVHSHRWPWSSGQGPG